MQLLLSIMLIVERAKGQKGKDSILCWLGLEASIALFMLVENVNSVLECSRQHLYSV